MLLQRHFIYSNIEFLGVCDRISCWRSIYFQRLQTRSLWRHKRLELSDRIDLLFRSGAIILIHWWYVIKFLNKVDSFQGKRIQRNICAALAVIIFCFSLRSFMFLARPVFGLMLPYPCFPYMFYPVPELVPTWILLYLTSSYTNWGRLPQSCSKILLRCQKKTTDARICCKKN